MALILATLLISAAAQAPVVPVTRAPDDVGRIMDVRGPWIAALRILPIPESLRRHHAPRPPWELGRIAAHGLDRVVLASGPARTSGWGAPQFVAMAPDGGMVAGWRSGTRFAVISPAGVRTDVECPYDRGVDCVRVEPDGAVFGRFLDDGRTARALTWRTIRTDGVGEPVELGVLRRRPGARLRVLRDDDRLLWIQGEGTLAIFDVAGAEVAALHCPGIEHFELDGVHGGVLFAHSRRSDNPDHGARAVARMVDLSSGAILEQPLPVPVASFTPRGWLTARHWVDPVVGTRVALDGRADLNQRCWKVGDQELWANGYMEVRRYAVGAPVEGAGPADNGALLGRLSRRHSRGSTLRGRARGPGGRARGPRPGAARGRRRASCPEKGLRSDEKREGGGGGALAGAARGVPGEAAGRAGRVRGRARAGAESSRGLRGELRGD